MRPLMTAMVSIMLLGSSLAAASAAAPTAPKADYVSLAKKLTPSLVRVEFKLRTDKGESPRAAGLTYICPNCGNRHHLDVGKFVTEERPLEQGGFIISPTQVVTQDPILHPRFIESVSIRVGDQLIPAKISAVAIHQRALILTTDKPLPGTTPLQFAAADADASLLAATFDRSNGAWTLNINPAAEKGYSKREDGREFVTLPAPCLLMTSKGCPVALGMREDQPADGSWKGSPEKWETISWIDLTAKLKTVENACSAGLLRVALSFRSPRKDNNDPDSVSYSRFDEQDSALERNVLGLLLNDKTVVVLANLKPKVTSRLERIKVYTAAGPVSAKFAGSLKDYGAFLATLEKPLPGAIALSDRAMLDLPGEVVLLAEVSLQGEKSVSYFSHTRVSNLEVGKKGRLYPQTDGEDSKEFLFDMKGAMLLLPVVHRSSLASEENRYSENDPDPTPLAYLQSTLGDTASIDKANVPLSESDENRLAWLGVVLQPLNRELARENNVSSQTQDGTTGAIVSYVYPGSPAEKAGIKVGYILLRLRMKDVPKPVEIKLERTDRFGGRSFPWEMLDKLPEQYYDRLPAPWPSAADFVSRTLTDYGFGKPFTAEFFADNKVIEKKMTVEQSPPHYGNAPFYKSPELGVTVRDMTYELRRYFQKKSDDPGVIISNEEPGSKASVAGIKPFEIITHIDGQPIMNIQDFQKLVKKQGEMRLSINRMLKGRQVKVVLAGTTSKPASGPAASQPSP